jgi:hypothetical protein
VLLIVYRDIVLNNWLLNPTGGRLTFVEADLVHVKAVAGLGNLTLSDGVWADPQRRLSVQ